MRSKIERIFLPYFANTTPSARRTNACAEAVQPAEKAFRAEAEICFFLMSLRNRHGVVPEDWPRFSVERRETTHEM